MKWINQPGNYSGDTWHIAAAMASSPDISVIQTVMPRDIKTARQARAFYRDIGISSARILCHFTDEDIESDLRLSRVQDRVKYVERNRAMAEDYLMSSGREGHIPLHVYKATCICMNKISHMGSATFRKYIQSTFTASLASTMPHTVTGIRRITNAISPQTVLVVGRFAKYLKDYDASCERTMSIVNHARSAGRSCRLLADTSSAECRKVSSECNLEVTDLYDLHEDTNDVDGTGRVDMRATATFWHQLAEPNRNHVVIGGRSGSVDAAAYLGMAVAEWDVFNPEDPESLRLANMAPDLCSTINISRDDGFAHNSHYRRLSSAGECNEIAMAAHSAFDCVLSGETVSVIHESQMHNYVIDE
ncbi:MAG: hypothetical protein RBT03_02490 [Kiritimatiellia bacterium]|jgi:hypothetical protein|nr:hypothetical protein [Kiritimatiellia bacterium]